MCIYIYIYIYICAYSNTNTCSSNNIISRDGVQLVLAAPDEELHLELLLQGGPAPIIEGKRTTPRIKPPPVRNCLENV